jgi:uncharacterized protein (DUF4415 family)
MPTVKTPKTTSPRFSKDEIAKAISAAAELPLAPSGIQWGKGVVTPGDGVAATVAAVRRLRGPNKSPTKEQVALRLDRDVVGAFRAGGPGWQTRMNAALKEWLETQPVEPRARRANAG